MICATENAVSATFVLVALLHTPQLLARIRFLAEAGIAKVFFTPPHLHRQRAAFLLPGSGAACGEVADALVLSFAKFAQLLQAMQFGSLTLLAGIGSMSGSCSRCAFLNEEGRRAGAGQVAIADLATGFATMNCERGWTCEHHDGCSCQQQ